MIFDHFIIKMKKLNKKVSYLGFILK